MVRMIAEQKVRYVLDLHGMSSRYGVDICVGNGGTATDALTDVLCGFFTDAGLSYSINEPYAAGAWALQLEIAPHCRDPHRHPGLTGALLYSFNRFVVSVHDGSTAL
jgi:hypothetical protein